MFFTKTSFDFNSIGFINFLVPSLDFTSNIFKVIEYIHYTLSVLSSYINSINQ